MTYKQILKKLSEQENVSVDEIEQEMMLALKLSGVNCRPKEFIKNISKSILKDYK